MAAREIATQLTEAISGLTDSLHPHGATPHCERASEWGVAAAAVVTPLTLLEMLIAVSIFVTSDPRRMRTSEPYRRQINRNRKGIAAIKDALDPLIRDSTIKGMSEAEKLNSAELVARLPDLKHLATIARAEKVAVNPEVVEKA